MKNLLKSALALVSLATVACDFGSEPSTSVESPSMQTAARHGDNMSRPDLIILRDGNLWGSLAVENSDYVWVWSDIAFESDAQPQSVSVDGLNGTDVTVEYCGNTKTFTNAWFVSVSDLDGCNDARITLGEAQDFNVFYQWN